MVSGNPCREYDNKGNWTGRWTCHNCYDLIRRWDTIDKKVIENIRNHYFDSKPGKIYNETNTCDRCKKEKLLPGFVYKEYDSQGNWKGWICYKCWHNDNNKKPGSHNSLRKLIADNRTGNLKDPRHILGYKCQKVTCELFVVEDLNEKLNNYRTPIDHSHIPNGIMVEIGEKLVDLSGKIPQTKGKNFDENIGCWSFGGFKRERNKQYDIMILWCVKNGDDIERGYIIPKNEIGYHGLRIYMNHLRNSETLYSYEHYRITNEEFIREANNIFRETKLYPTF